MDGEPDDVKPWVWIAWLAVGPILGSIAVQWYVFVAVRRPLYLGSISADCTTFQTRMLVQAQSMITQLVFDHALRIRVKAEVGSSSSSSATSSAVTTPDSASVAERSEGAESSADEAETAVSEATGTSTTKAPKSKSAQSVSEREVPKDADAASKDEKKDDKKADNLVGKLNNLVTTDLNNLTEGRDFLFVGAFPQRTCSVCVLTVVQCSTLLSKSAFVSGSCTPFSAGGRRA